jgi:hypothetical protein
MTYSPSKGGRTSGADSAPDFDFVALSFSTHVDSPMLPPGLRARASVPPEHALQVLNYSCNVRERIRAV